MSINRMSERKKDRPNDIKTERKSDRNTDRLFSLVIKTKVVKNVNKKDKT